MSMPSLQTRRRYSSVSWENTIADICRVNCAAFLTVSKSMASPAQNGREE